jgi:ribosomal protein L3 glutamine methyltransferase
MSENQHTVASLIEQTAARFQAAGLHYGHGTDNARDEAAWLVLHVAGLPLDGRFNDWGRLLGKTAVDRVNALAGRRILEGLPLAYVLGSAWFAGHEFTVTPDVLVPRSPIAELILDDYQPWLDLSSPRRILDLCTGSGCIAIATALQLPGARVDAADISPAALAVARQNVHRHQLESRVQLIESDLFRSIPRFSYDLIVTNPPYVPEAALGELPAEYRNEPGLGLRSGRDGLDATLAIMLDAPDFLREYGVLICEVGESEARLAEALPRVPFLWLEFSGGGSGVFLLDRSQLLDARSALLRLMEERNHVV